MKQKNGLFKSGAYSEIRQILMERLWKGEVIDKEAVGEEFYKDRAMPSLAAQSILTGLRKRIERYTGKILICREGKYRLVFEDSGEVIYEMNRRRKKVVSALDSFGRPAEFLLKQDATGKFASVVNDSLEGVMKQVNRYSFDKVSERAEKQRALPTPGTRIPSYGEDTP